MLIKFDFLTLTSKKATLRAFFFFLMRKTSFSFTLRPKFMTIGGPAYKGWAFQRQASIRPDEFFIGQRRNTRGFEYILTMPGEICNLFVVDFLKNSNLLKGEWAITRLDLQLTLGYDFSSENQLTLLYWNFYKNQSALEKKAKKRKVKLTANGEYLLVSVGCKKQGRSEWKVYSSELDVGIQAIPQEVNVRLEVTIKNSLQYLNCLGESEGNIEKCNFRIIQRTLLEAADTFLLSKHRSLVKDWFYYLKAQSVVPEPKLECRGPSEAQRSSRGVTRGVISSGSQKSRFSKELALVSQALESFSQMVQSKRQTFSHKQMQFLNDQFSSRDWRMSWNIRKEWAIIPRESNPLWRPLFAPLPQKARAFGSEKRL